jgi:hypothetical protein
MRLQAPQEGFQTWVKRIATTATWPWCIDCCLCPSWVSSNAYASSAYLLSLFKRVEIASRAEVQCEMM